MGIERFRYIMQRYMISRLLGIAAIFILIREPEDYFIYYGIIVFAAIINLTANTVLLFRRLHISFKNLRWRHHIHHTRITYLISLFYAVTGMLDNVFLGMVSTAAAVGLYAMPARIVRLAATLITDMFLVLFPRTVALMHEKKEKELQQTFLKSVQLITLLTIPAGIGIFLLDLPLVQSILSERFYEASANLRILALLPFIKTYSLFLGKQVLMSHGWEKKYLFALVTGGLLFILSTLILSSYYHHTGACYALILGEAIVLVVCYYQVKQAMPHLIIVDYRTLLQSLVCAALFIPIIGFIKNCVSSPILVVLFSVGICVPVYFAAQTFVMKNNILLGLYRSGKSRLRS